MQDNNRAEALARLAAHGVKADPSAVADSEVALAVSKGDAIYAGGDVERVLIGEAHLTYREEKGGELLHAFATIGDTILVNDAAAKRLDGLNVTVTKAKARELAKAPAVAASPAAAASTKTDEELEAMNVGDLVAHINQHPEDKVRVRGLEGKRETARKTILKATAVDGDDEDEELDDDEE